MKPVLLISLVTLVAFSCAKRTVVRINPSEQIDLSGRWNDTDSKLVAQQMVKEFLEAGRYQQYADDKGSRPAIIVGYIKNKTTEHIDPDNFVKKFELEIFNSGLADLVEDPEFRERLRQERADQQEFSSPETTAQWGKEVGADLMLLGEITSEIDTYNKQRVTNYIITLRLSDLETNKRVWYGQKEIKKYIKN